MSPTISKALLLGERNRVAMNWFASGIFLDKTKSPDGKGFRLKLHETNPGAPLSPFYLNFRLLRSFPGLKIQTADLLAQLVHSVQTFHFSEILLADIPTAITPVVATMSDNLNSPMITPRTDDKKHGTGAKIDGVYQAGQTVLLFDDLITKASSKFEAIAILEAAKLKVRDIFVLVDRQQGGSEELAEKGYHLHAAWTIRDLLAFYRGEHIISKQIHEEILAYLG